MMNQLNIFFKFGNEFLKKSYYIGLNVMQKMLTTSRKKITFQSW